MMYFIRYYWKEDPLLLWLSLFDIILGTVVPLIGILYEYMQQEKMIQMDYSRIDSPEVQQLLQRIGAEQNWGDHFHSLRSSL